MTLATSLLSFSVNADSRCTSSLMTFTSYAIVDRRSTAHADSHVFDRLVPSSRHRQFVWRQTHGWSSIGEVEGLGHLASRPDLNQTAREAVSLCYRPRPVPV